MPPDRDQLAYDLYSASFRQPSPDARFTMLMMAMEAMIEQAERSDEARQHVDRLIEQTKTSTLPANEVQSIVNNLDGLRKESIGRAGRKVAEKLGDRLYLGESPPKFFTECYDLRSRLVHGHYPRPSREEVSSHATQLELFVSHLLSLELLDALDEAPETPDPEPPPFSADERDPGEAVDPPGAIGA